MAHAEKENNSSFIQDAELRKKVHQLGEDFREVGRVAKKLASDKVEHIKGNAEEYYEQSKTKAQSWEKNLETRIQKNPLRSIAIAAGVGALAALILRRR